ncbi:glycosyl hydrolase family 18 protein [Alicyclobacillus macrosporangiidus]|uniref:Glycosyl hydrolases family 18 n=1 Tax=Alicyclobacillus macrosporangiidus TaxID=392015 RepID=A0A1I7FWR9_9BACL|nr:glycosyl hydrolase family 18 protein [Alicyclobacillus macrosporangiidus]SFU40654.1 Glycosyl hydrolases family 18 [Alicyclobacillus macrosporangiidus]
MSTGKFMTWIVNYLARSNTEMSSMAKKFYQVGIFEFFVNTDGSIRNTMTQAQIDNALAHPQVKWFLTVQALGGNFSTGDLSAIWTNEGGLQDRVVSNIAALLDQYPWAAGIDLDFEQGGSSKYTDQAVAFFQRVYNLCHARGKLLHVDLPGLTGPGQSLGGEYWCDYAKLAPYFDSCVIMSYGYSWSGSAPAAITPKSWGKAVYDFAVTCIPPEKIFLGVGMYGIRWQIFEPVPAGQYRGLSMSYYGILAWLLGVFTHGGSQPHIPWAAFWDDDEKTPYVFLHVYDWMRIDDIARVDSPAVTFNYFGDNVLTAYNKVQKATITGQVAAMWAPSSTNADENGAIVTGTSYFDGHQCTYVTAREPQTIVTTDPNTGKPTTIQEVPGTATYNFSVPTSGTYHIVLVVNFPWWSMNRVTVSVDGRTFTASQPTQWYPLARTPHYYDVGTMFLAAGSHTLTFEGGSSAYGADLYGFVVCQDFSFVMDGGEGWFYLRPQRMKDTNGNMVLPSIGYVVTAEVLRHPPEYATVWADNWVSYTQGAGGSLDSWYNLTGSWTVQGTYPEAGTLVGSGTLQIGYTQFTDLAVWANFSFTGNGEAGIIIGPYRCGIRADGTVVFNGQTMGKTDPKVSHELRVRCRQGTYVVYVDKQKIGDPVSGLQGSNTFGLYATNATMSCTQLTAGDAYTYMPQESITIVTPAGSQQVGRIQRNSQATWIQPWGYFQVPNGVEEYDTRVGTNIDISSDYDYVNSAAIPVSTSSPIEVQIKHTDAGVWTRRVFLCDQEGASIAYYGDLNVFSYWWQEATLNYGLAGVAMWQLGLEDPRIFDLIPDQW